MSVIGFFLLLAFMSSSFNASQGTLIISAGERDVVWENFKAKFLKTYASATDESNRKAIFNDRLSVISAHNSNRSSTFKMAINQFADRSVDELKAYTGFIQPKQNAIKSFFDNIVAYFSSSSIVHPKKNGVSLPASCMQPIKNQIQCGSCWAFAAVAAIEFNSCVQTGKAVALSEQQVTDCTYDSRRDGCGGGLPSEAIIAIARKTFGINTNSSYPYTSGVSKKSGTCKHTTADNGATVQLLFPIVQFSSRNPDISGIMSTLDQKGLVTVALYLTLSFYFYTSGVYTTSNIFCNSWVALGAHAITIVGYGTDEETGLDYWWGTDWGLAGYILFQRGVDLCHIESWAAVGVNTGGFFASILSKIG